MLVDEGLLRDLIKKFLKDNCTITAQFTEYDYAGRSYLTIGLRMKDSYYSFNNVLETCTYIDLNKFINYNSTFVQVYDKISKMEDKIKELTQEIQRLKSINECSIG